ncbi:MAG: hypothetical protein LBT46_13240 [Planctomycetaceae bacterium]|nr:hypothetical protein [Planctomycetaceae bacterium]
MCRSCWQRLIFCLFYGAFRQAVHHLPPLPPLDSIYIKVHPYRMGAPKKTGGIHRNKLCGQYRENPLFFIAN